MSLSFKTTTFAPVAAVLNFQPRFLLTTTLEECEMRESEKSSELGKVFSVFTFSFLGQSK